MENIKNKQFIFANIFIIANRLQTACEKIQTDITMKQWLMLAIASATDGIQNLSEIGRLMGCSRQNVRKLANPLLKKDFIRLVKGDNNSINIIPTKKFESYSKKMEDKNLMTLNLLFENFTQSELVEACKFVGKFYEGLEKVVKYGEDLNEGK